MASRSWCWTFFIAGATTLESVCDLVAGQADHRYTIAQLETTAGGRIHVQGYSEFSSPKRMGVLRNVLPGVHCEKRRGSRDSARDYCRKDESRVDGPIERGEWKGGGQGARNDLVMAKELLDSGADEKTIAEECFGSWVRYRKSFTAYAQLLREPRTWPTECIILWGEPGTGKTRQVWDLGLSVYALPQPQGSSVWFDGYTGQDVLLLDDFYGWLPLHLLLKLGDRYPLSVPIKGGMVRFVSKFLYITSNKPWTEWYKWSELGSQLEGAFRRRIVRCTHFSGLVN